MSTTQDGTLAWLSGQPITANPHPSGSYAHKAWAQAWARADYEMACERTS